MTNQELNSLNWNFILPALLLAAAFITVAVVLASSFYKVKTNNLISVAGSVEKHITSDIVKWKSSFSKDVGPDKLISGTNQMKEDLKKIKEYFLNSGIKNEEITIDPIQTWNKEEYKCKREKEIEVCSNEFTGYNLAYNIKIETTNIQSVAKLAEEAPINFINQGIIYTSSSPEYYYSYEKLKDLKLELLGEASANAKKRAEIIAENSGSKLGSLQSANLGVFQITQVNSTDFEDYGIYDTSTIEKKVSVVLRAKYMVEK